MTRVVAVVQARASSTRLPGKVLAPLGDRAVVDWVLRAASAADGVDDVVLATSEHASDDRLAAHAVSTGFPVVRGDLDDVLSRFRRALERHPGDGVVRLTADCPLLDPHLVAAVVAVWRSDPSLDYVSTVAPRTLPRGLDVELVSASALAELDSLATGYHRTHVTSFVREHPERFRLLGVTAAPPADDLRVTLDTAEDLRLLRGLVGLLGDRPPGWREVVDALRADSSLAALNAGVRQKALEEG